MDLNNEAAGQTWQHLTNAVNAVQGTVHYERIAEHGPKRPEINQQWPLVPKYVFILLKYLFSGNMGISYSYQSSTELEIC